MEIQERLDRAQARVEETIDRGELARLRSCETAWKAVYNRLDRLCPGVTGDTGLADALARINHLADRAGLFHE